MATTEKNYQIIQKVGEDEFLILHPETSGDNVKVAADGIAASNVNDALEELNSNISAITGGGVVTGVKGEAEESYRLGNVNITKANVGLGNVDNTADADKPISTAVQSALDQKQGTLTFDDVPTADSTNPVKSSGIKSAIDTAKQEAIAAIPDVSEFITKAVTDLVNYYTKTEIDGKVDTLEGMISAIPKFAIDVVEDLPESDISETTLYLLKTSETETGNLYTEYIYVDGAWEELGAQTLDLSDYVTTDALSEAIASFITTEDVNGLITAALTPYAKTESLSAIATSGNLSDATQDATHRVVTDAEKATWNAKQDALTFDETPTTSSSNPVKSGGVKAAIDTAIAGVNASIEDIVDGTTQVASAAEAAASVKLKTAQTFSLSGDATGSTTFDGSAAATIAVTLKNSGVSAGSYSAVTVDTKGRVTAGAQLVEVGETGQDAPSATLAIGGIFFKELA